MFTVKLEDRKGWEEYGTIKKKKKREKSDTLALERQSQRQLDL